jgi:hypothetical protein
MGVSTTNAATTVPYILTGSPVYLGSDTTGQAAPLAKVTDVVATTSTWVDGAFAASGGSEKGIYELTTGTATTAGVTHRVQLNTDYSGASIGNLTGTVVFNYDLASIFDALKAQSMTIDIETNGTDNNAGGPAKVTFANYTDITSGAGMVTLDCCEGDTGIGSVMDGNATSVNIIFDITSPSGALAAGTYPMAVDFFSFNSTTDVASAIYRMEVEEDGVDGTFTGTVDYASMHHEGNSTNATSTIVTNSDEISLLIAADMTGTSAPRVLYGDQDENNAQFIIGAQLDANTHTGTVTFDATGYGTDTIVHVTVNDPDLNVDSGVRDSYSSERAESTTTQAGDTFSVSYNDTIRSVANLKLVETGLDTGVFVGQFNTSALTADIGKDLKFTYYDRKDAGGTSVDTYTSIKIQTESGSISFDRQVYPVPFFNGWMTSGDGDTLDDPFGQTPTPTAGDTHGNVTVYFTVTDSDYTGEQITGEADRVYIKLNGDVIATAGAASADLSSGETGPLTEIERGTSIYEGSLSLDHKETSYESASSPSITGVCTAGCAAFNVTSGMVLQAAYNDANDEAGVATTFYDSATVDLRTGTISTDKEVYVIGQDFIVTVNDPDLNLDSDSTESYSTSIVEWDSDADSSELLSAGSLATFAPNPSLFRETGSNTGVFQTVFTFPGTIGSTDIENGEK